MYSYFYYSELFMQKYYNCSVFMAIYNLIMVFVGKRNSDGEWEK